MKSTVTVDIILDKRFIKMDHTHPVKIRVTYERKQRYYSTNTDLTPPQFKRVMSNKRSKEETTVYEHLYDRLRDIKDIVEQMSDFSFDKLKTFYKEHFKEVVAVTIPPVIESHSTVFSMFDIIINQSETEGRVGNADVMTCARNSLEKFKHDLEFVDITPTFLEDYEKWFLKQGYSITTVGIYLRELRNVVNTAISYDYKLMSRDLYPFNNKDNPKGYKIPRGNNIKKALSRDQIKLLMSHPLIEGSPADKARDFWYFTYLNNGINHKDICKMKFKDIYKSQIHFNRSKTIRSTRDKDRTVIASLLKESEKIIDKWGNKSREPEDYVFPILTKDLSLRRAHEVQQTHLQSINKFNRNLANTLGLGVALTTIVARHSFATVMVENGVDLAIIKELMGHSSITTTEIYVKPFNSKTRKKNALLLLE